MPYYSDPSPYPGIHRFKLPLTGSPLKYINAYLIPGRDGHLLIDTCWKFSDAAQALDQELKAIDINPADIKRIIITHAHVDHYGLAAGVIKQSNARLALHAVENKMINLRYRQSYRFSLDANAIWRTSGVLERYIPDPKEMVNRYHQMVTIAEPDELFQGGEIIDHNEFRFEVIWTPGHSPGHICLYDANHKLFFSGDHILPGITSNIGLHPHSGPNPLGDYMGSLRNIAHLDVDLMLPAHGPPIKGFTNRIKHILAHHQKRLDEMLQILTTCTEPVNAFTLVTRMKWYSKGAPNTWQSLRDFDQRLAISEVMAHLELMAADGRLIKQERDGIFYYQCS